jgi:hypothetical protein
MKRLIILASLMLANCAASGPKYDLVSHDVLTPKPNEAKLIIARTDHYFGSAGTYWVEVNGQQVCDLHNASFMAHDLLPGRSTIASSVFGGLGTSTIGIDAKAGETIYVILDIKKERYYAAAFGGYGGEAMAEAVDDNAGPVHLIRVKSADLHEYNHEENCH